ncbi:MAG TPA: DNA gyrase inhibitor YacG [Phycisphaerae bacterium]|nr:DNA gyrase inhibitor YacG [Phycisphaerae bacterium]
MDKPKPIGNDGNMFRCPMCKAYLPHANVPTFPFCSDRCRLLDLNNWMEGNYSVSRPMDPGEEEETPRPPASPPR